MIEGSGSISVTNGSRSGRGGPKTYGSYGSRSGSATLLVSNLPPPPGTVSRPWRVRERQPSALPVRRHCRKCLWSAVFSWAKWPPPVPVPGMLGNSSPARKFTNLNKKTKQHKKCHACVLSNSPVQQRLTPTSTQGADPNPLFLYAREGR